MERASYQQFTPSIDEKPMRDVQWGLVGGPTFYVAYDLGLFRQLAEQSMTLHQMANALGISARAAQALLSVSCSWGFVEKSDGEFSLSASGRVYLDPSSPTFMGTWLDGQSRALQTQRMSYESIREAIVSDRPTGEWGQEIFNYSAPEAIESDAALRVANNFQTLSLGPSTAWPQHVDLSKHRMILDIGGASGAHAMGATSRWPNLSGIVLDFEPVCDAAEKIIAGYGLTDSVKTYAGDMFKDPFPDADVHFYSNILHDWPPERGAFLMRKSFDALESGGLVILHEMLFNDDKTGPPTVAAINLNMLRTMMGQQYSGAELSDILEEAGFTNITTTQTFGYYSIVVGAKP